MIIFYKSINFYNIKNYYKYNALLYRRIEKLMLLTAFQ